ncbi:MAG TPA: hypothetical protein VF399_00270 [bacterium]
MKKLILLIALLVLPLLAAEETNMGMVYGAEGDSLILADGLKVYVPGLSLGGRYVTDNASLDLSTISFPFTASLVTMETSDPAVKSGLFTYVKIYKLYRVVEGRLVEK